MDHETKRALAGRGMTLHERLGRVEKDEGTVDDGQNKVGEDAKALIQTWRDNVADGDQAAFERRLEQHGLSTEALESHLSTETWPELTPLPDWVAQIDTLERHVAESPIPDVEPAESEPFPELISVVVSFASREIDWDEAADYISDGGIEALEMVLADQLRTYCEHSLFVEFKTFVAQRDRDLAFAADPDVSEAPHQYYDQFVERTLTDGFESFFSEYAFLARLVSTLIDQWQMMVREFLSRVSQDLPSLTTTFLSSAEPQCVVEVEALGDRHDHGRTTMRVDFSDGTTVAYKPHAIDCSTTFDAVVERISDTLTGPDLRTLEYLNRDEYGWMEWVDYSECTSESAVERYYHRAGQLLCLLYTFGFTDGHLENVVAAGEHPVIIDRETLTVAGVDGSSELDRPEDGSVVKTGLLPHVSLGGDANVTNSDNPPTVGAFAVDQVDTSTRERVFKNVNSDAMEMEYRSTRPPSHNNIPTRDGEPKFPDEYVDQVIEGFERTYEYLSKQSTDGWIGELLHRFEETKVRWLRRTTRVYARLLRRLRMPEYLQTGLKFGIEVETLARDLVKPESDSSDRRLYKAECQALHRLDVPRFTLLTTGRGVSQSGESIDTRHVEAPSIETVSESIESLSANDLAQQRDFIRLSLGNGNVDTPERMQLSPPSEARSECNNTFRDHARAIFDRLFTNAVRTADGSLYWFRTERTEDGAKTTPIADDLYQGRLGICLFAGGLYRVEGETRYRTFVHDTIAPIIDRVQGSENYQLDFLGMQGYGSVIYVLTKLHLLLDEPKYVTLAGDVATAMTREKHRSGTEFDVVGGTAGLVLGLLSLYEVTEEQAVLEQAVAAGESLISERIDTNAGVAWPYLGDSRAIQGFAHGAAGIGYALARLGAESGDHRFERAARDAVAFERELYVEAERNWTDLRTDSGFSNSWCYGRPGIGLARIGTRRALGDTTVGREIQAVAGGTDPTRLLPRDHLCCGNFGRVAWLLEAARETGSEQLYRDAEMLAAHSCWRTERNGAFIDGHSTESLYDPAFFTGELGIGYALLRLEEPELPSVLLFE